MNDDVFTVAGQYPELKVTCLKDKSAACDALYIPDGVKTIGAGAFYNIKARVVVLPNGVTEICAGAFERCAKLKAIFIPKSVSVIGKDSFADCRNLKIYCESEPQIGWIDEPDRKKVYYDDMTEAFNFHRSAGSFDDHYIVERVEIIRNTYNPEKCPVITGVSRDEFIKLLKTDKF